MAIEEAPGPVGQRIKRTEDPKFITEDGRTTFALFVQPIGGAPGTASAIPLAPGEQVVTPAF